MHLLRDCFGHARKDQHGLLGALIRPIFKSDPDRFDIHRPELRRHFAFGRWTHMCLGAPLARLETKVVIEQLLDRLPGVRLVAGQREEWEPHVLTPRLKHLRIEWGDALRTVR